MIITKPCFVCNKDVTLPDDGVWFDPDRLFAVWSAENEIVCDWRARFDGVRENLKWASLDEDAAGAHAICSLEWAIEQEGYNFRYPKIPKF